MRREGALRRVRARSGAEQPQQFVRFRRFRAVGADAGRCGACASFRRAASARRHEPRRRPGDLPARELGLVDVQQGGVGSFGAADGQCSAAVARRTNDVAAETQQPGQALRQGFAVIRDHGGRGSHCLSVLLLRLQSGRDGVNAGCSSVFFDSPWCTAPPAAEEPEAHCRLRLTRVSRRLPNSMSFR